MEQDFVTPALIRVGRALCNSTQDQLADAAGVSASTVSEFESGKRPGKSSAARALRAASENQHIVFISGDDAAGPGVRFCSQRPVLARRPRYIQDNVISFQVEWAGSQYSVYLADWILEELEAAAMPSAADLVRVFEKYEATILDAVKLAIKEDPYVPDNRIHLSESHIRRARSVRSKYSKRIVQGD